jgi:hypothetical protein
MTYSANYWLSLRQCGSIPHYHHAYYYCKQSGQELLKSYPFWWSSYRSKKTCLQVRLTIMISLKLIDMAGAHSEFCLGSPIHSGMVKICAKTKMFDNQLMWHSHTLHATSLPRLMSPRDIQKSNLIKFIHLSFCFGGYSQGWIGRPTETAAFKRIVSSQNASCAVFLKAFRLLTQVGSFPP